MPETLPTAVATPIRFAALDGMSIAGVLFEPAAGTPVEHAVVVNNGGGIPAAYYRRFARFLADHGVAVLTYDYRGIGQSRPARLRRFQAVVEDWSEWDCGGAIAELRTRYPEAEAIGIGHSVGAMLFGAAPNVAQLQRFIFVGAHTGFVGDYRKGYRLPMALLWHGVMPALTRMVGYFPGRALRLGDDIPAGVAMQWAGRRTAAFGREAGVADSDRATRLVNRFAAIAAPALVVSISDDAFATPAGTRRLLALFPGLVAALEQVTPADAAVRKLGHFGYFRAATGARLWPRVLAYILHSSPGAGRRPGQCRPPGRGKAHADSPLFPIGAPCNGSP